MFFIDCPSKTQWQISSHVWFHVDVSTSIMLSLPCTVCFGNVSCSFILRDLYCSTAEINWKSGELSRYPVCSVKAISSKITSSLLSKESQKLLCSLSTSDSAAHFLDNHFNSSLGIITRINVKPVIISYRKDWKRWV